MERCSIEERVGAIRSLYDFHVSTVKRYNDSELMEDVKKYFLKMLTDLFGEYVREHGYRRDVVDTLYEKALGDEFLVRFLGEVNEQGIRSRRMRCEYRLLREGNAAKLRRYFAIRTGNIAKI